MSSVTIPTEKELRERPFVTLNFVVVGGSPSHRHDLCQQLVALSAESEFLHCTAASFGSVEELAKGVSEITENVLCVVVVDMTSVLDCESLEKWLVGLHKLQFFGKVCIAIYNVHRASERICSTEFIHAVRTKHRPTPIFFHGPDKAKWHVLAASILRWGEIAAGLRGEVTVQYLETVIKQPDDAEDT
ncbi:uncharacterized protein LOC144100882 isoform X1 [Amblyomma americanum]